MKKAALFILAISAVAFGQSSDSSPFSGKWTVHQSIAGNDSDSNCTFTQKEDDLTGTCTSDQGTVNITGKIDGKKVSWSYNSDYNGTALTIKFNGTLDSERITGEVNVDPFNVSGDFTATRPK